jgi:FMN-dependent NADH-azoreductase
VRVTSDEPNQIPDDKEAIVVKLLRIDSSPMGETAISRQLTKEFVQRWLGANPHSAVIRRDLATITIPVVNAAWVAANYTPEESRTHQQNELLKLSTEFITELLDSDEYVIGMPMHNWGQRSSLKLWVDQIVTASSRSERPLAARRVTLTGKRATFIIAAGAVYAPDSANASKNYLVPWLRTLFGSLGIKDMQFVLADGTKDTNKGKIDRATFIAPHIEAIHALFLRKNESQSRPALTITPGGQARG